MLIAGYAPYVLGTLEPGPFGQPRFLRCAGNLVHPVAVSLAETLVRAYIGDSVTLDGNH